MPDKLTATASHGPPEMRSSDGRVMVVNCGFAVGFADFAVAGVVTTVGVGTLTFTERLGGFNR